MADEDAASRKRRLQVSDVLWFIFLVVKHFKYQLLYLIDFQELRNKATGKSIESDNGAGDASLTSKPSDASATEDENPVKKPKFRNYQPHDKKLAETIVPVAPAEVEISDILTQAAASAVRPGVQPKVSLLQVELEKAATEEINLVPRKINADLKAQIAPKLEKLKRRTQKAIVEILREKMSMDAIDE